LNQSISLSGICVNQYKQAMKNKILFFCVLLHFICIIAPSQAIGFQWAGKMGSNMQDEGHGIAVDTLGNVYTTGFFETTCDFDPGPGVFNMVSLGDKDIFISKLNSSGNLVWAKRIGKNGGDFSNSIAVDDSGNVYITGSFTGSAVDFDPGPGTYPMSTAGSYDIYILKLDAAGNFAWAKQFGAAAPDNGNSITIDKAGYIYATGSFSSACDFDPGAGVHMLAPQGAFVLKLDAGGNFKWAENIGEHAGAISMKTDQHGNAYITGTFGLTSDFDPGASAYSLTPFGGVDIFVSKLDSSGNFIWAKQMGGTGDETANDIAVDTTGNVYLTGKFQLTCDFDPGAASYPLTSISAAYWDIFTEKLDVNGDFLWAFRIGGTSTGQGDVGFGIQVDDSANVYTTGNFVGNNIDFDPGPSSFPLYSGNNQCIFIQKLNTNGNFIWACQMGAGSLNVNSGHAITVDKHYNIYTTGFFVYSAVDFDPGAGVFNLGTSGGYDIFVQKLGLNVTTGIESSDKNNFISLYPNPNNGMFKLRISNEIQQGKFILVNSIGQNVYETKLVNGENEIRISNLAPGMYTYKVIGNEGEINRGKIIVE
jgi:hypothetical protein